MRIMIIYENLWLKTSVAKSESQEPTSRGVLINFAEQRSMTKKQKHAQ